jgi:hypothetical protein
MPISLRRSTCSRNFAMIIDSSWSNYARLMAYATNTRTLHPRAFLKTGLMKLKDASGFYSRRRGYEERPNRLIRWRFNRTDPLSGPTGFELNIEAAFDALNNPGPLERLIQKSNRPSV